MKLKLLVLLGLFFCVQLRAQHKHKSSDSTGNASNHHMHERPVQELISDFDSKDRDAYQQPEKVIQYLGDLHGKKIMDLGAGSGYFTFRLAKQAALVIAADVNDEFQAHIKKRIKSDSVRNVELRKVPFDTPLLKPGEVDIVVVVNTYHHIEQREDYFKLVRQGLSKNGDLIIIDFFKVDQKIGPPTAHKLSIDQVVMELKAAGFNSFEVNVDLLLFQYIIRAR